MDPLQNEVQIMEQVDVGKSGRVEGTVSEVNSGKGTVGDESWWVPLTKAKGEDQHIKEPHRRWK